MINGKSILAIIPARGGSKQLPRKNVLPLAEKPLISWSIEAGLKSRYIDRLVVSSEDDEILQISQKAGAEIITRPHELAAGDTPSISVVEHVIKNMDCGFDLTILLQPTSPLRNEKHIDEAFELLVKKDANSIVSVCKTEHNPLWANTLPEDGNLDHFLRDNVKNIRRQDLPVYYQLNGAIYICTTERLLKEKTFIIMDNIFAYKMKRIDSIDIDDKLDYLFAGHIKAYFS